MRRNQEHREAKVQSSTNQSNDVTEGSIGNDQLCREWMEITVAKKRLNQTLREMNDNLRKLKPLILAVLSERPAGLFFSEGIREENGRSNAMDDTNSLVSGGLITKKVTNQYKRLNLQDLKRLCIEYFVANHSDEGQEACTTVGMACAEYVWSNRKRNEVINVQVETLNRS